MRKSWAAEPPHAPTRPGAFPARARTPAGLRKFTGQCRLENSDRSELSLTLSRRCFAGLKAGRSCQLAGNDGANQGGPERQKAVELRKVLGQF
jgi:hypothetical protein